MAGLITATEVTTFVRGFKTSDADEITQLIDWADGVLAGWLCWPVPSGSERPTLCRATYVDYLDGPTISDRRVLRLRMAPLGNVSEVADDPDWDYASNVVDVSDYLGIREGKVILSRQASHAWNKDIRTIRVTYTAGFDTTTPPYHVKQAMLLLLRELWRFKTVQGLPNAADVDDPEALITPDVKELLGQHRRLEAGLA